MFLPNWNNFFHSYSLHLNEFIRILLREFLKIDCQQIKCHEFFKPFQFQSLMKHNLRDIISTMIETANVFYQLMLRPISFDYFSKNKTPQNQAFQYLFSNHPTVLPFFLSIHRNNIRKKDFQLDNHSF